MARAIELAGLIDEYLKEAGLWLEAIQLLADRRQEAAVIAWIEEATPCVAEREVIMLLRERDPFAGCWVAPGGRIELGEKPLAALIREMGEETGLILRDPELRLITSEVGPDAKSHDWVSFVFRSSKYEGELDTGWDPEGKMERVKLAELARRRLPAVDRYLLYYVFPEAEAVFDATGLCPDARGREWRRKAPPRRDQAYFARVEYTDRGTIDWLEVRPLARRSSAG